MADAQTPSVLFQQSGAVARIVFSNPARHNAMTLAMWQGLNDRLDQCAKDNAVRIVVLAGAGQRSFVSGADISEFADQRSSAAAVQHYNSVSEAAEAAVAEFPKPIIAEIGGYCLGGGVGIAIGCDLRIVSDTASFAVPAGRLGLGYAYDGVAKLINAIGPAATAELFLTGRRFNAQEALAMGLVNTVVAREELTRHVADLAEQIAENAPLTMAAFKAALLEHRKSPGTQDLDRVAQMISDCYASQDYAEGQAAFRERRAPVFKGR